MQSLDPTSEIQSLKYEIADVFNTHSKIDTSQIPFQSLLDFLGATYLSALRYPNPIPKLEENWSHQTGILGEISSAVGLVQIFKEK